MRKTVAFSPEKWTKATIWKAAGATKYYMWHLRLLTLSGFDLMLWFPDAASTSTLVQSDVDDAEAVMAAMDTLMGSSGPNTHNGVMVGNPFTWDKEYYKLRYDIGGQIITAVLIRPDKYSVGTNFVVNGSDIDITIDSSVVETLYNATVDAETDPGALIVQTDLEATA